MLPFFDTESGLPLPNINLAQRKGVPDPDLPFLVSTAEVSTLQLEFRYLSYLTEEETYWEKVEAKAACSFVNLISAQTGQFVPSAIRLGPRGDSHYEYLSKQYIQTNQTENVYREMYDDATNAVHGNLISKSPYSRMTYTSELIAERHGDGQLFVTFISWRLTPKQDHLVCFFGGSLMLGATITGAAVIPDWKTGVELVRSCVDTHDTKTRQCNGHISRQVLPLIDISKALAQVNQLRTMRDIFFGTGDRRVALLGLPSYWRHPLQTDWCWDIFQAIEKHCKVQTGGYASIVDEVPAQQEDKMETFLMSETLKYLFLLFKDASELPLDKYVLNIEGSIPCRDILLRLYLGPVNASGISVALIFVSAYLRFGDSSSRRYGRWKYWCMGYIPWSWWCYGFIP
ncbi:seven-hairpin glycosidase [Gymnopus androsaceus JB14]|nr:seven-hairpin glycosidase [Gymnopus androsaceus JB14]